MTQVGRFALMRSMKTDKPDATKPPAFVALWIDRFLGGTASMTAEEVGVYLLLLLHQASHDWLPNDTRRLAVIGRVDPGAFEGMWRAVLRGKFEEDLDDPGKLRNGRMVVERRKAIGFSATQSEKGKRRHRGSAGAQPGLNPGSASQTQTQRETQRETQNQRDTARRRATPPSWSEVLGRPEYQPLREHREWAAKWAEWVEWCQTPGTKAKAPKGPQAAKVFNRTLEDIEGTIAAIDRGIAKDWRDPDPAYLVGINGKPPKKETYQERLQRETLKRELEDWGK